MSENTKISPGQNVILIRPEGPLICRGNFTLLAANGEELAKGEEELWLCRCGASKKTPFCDGSHKKIEFDDGLVPDERAEELPEASGPVTITCRANAMYVVKGPVIIRSEDGRYETRRSKAALCRCGASGKKPFCDASHKTTGFEVD